MLLRVGKNNYDSDRIPIMIYWKNEKIKETFFTEIIPINNFARYNKISSFTYIKAGEKNIKDYTNVNIRFESREEKNNFLKHLHNLGNKCNMYVICPEDIPYNIISDWIKVSLKDFGVKEDAAVEISY